ncbi:glycogen synthase [Segniliparus rugosus]|uniref:Corynebacterium family glycogen synthase n=1 Tax=Segniliparus rugosus (strain ATCC BAA-974 / DSM 45345 / CCUG 50838 / CIP 108380 / JCM 13579 / CDC 945) TaxID=679197 RepID=E5XPK2_SEGRC|nr:glycogen synthase [Segniliparus rugosus]EFV13717.1 corynebacterium family glycogen synthase [Segniliparus rugosus ATCC BAA-974]
MHVAMLTREYPPEVYGGAGVHVTELVANLRELCEVDVHCIGEPRPGAVAHQPDPALLGANAALRTLSADLRIAAAATGVDVVHSHTWYANLAGHMASLLHGIPHVVTSHSLEPLRPWKAEQLGGGYRISSWAEAASLPAAAAVIAVSQAMATDVLATYPLIDPARVHVVRNGIDVSAWYPDPNAEAAVRELGLDPARPIVAFVGRITHQKGLNHLIAAAHRFVPEAQLLLCAGAPDTPEIAAQTRAAVAELQEARDGVVWAQEMLSSAKIRELVSAATVFVCPSIYEPLGIVNLEAMATATAVVGSSVGGIPEVVDHGETGLLVSYEPSDPQGFEHGLADAVNALVNDTDLAIRMGRAGRAKVVREFSWTKVAADTLKIYEHVAR